MNVRVTRVGLEVDVPSGYIHVTARMATVTQRPGTASVIPVGQG